MGDSLSYLDNLLLFLMVKTGSVKSKGPESQLILVIFIAPVIAGHLNLKGKKRMIFDIVMGYWYFFYE